MVTRNQISPLPLLLLIFTSLTIAFAQRPELVVQTGHELPIWTFAFSTDGRAMASGSPDQTVRLWDVTTGRELRTFRWLTGDMIHSLGFSGDNKTLAGASWSGLTVWDVATGRELLALRRNIPDNFYSIALSPDGKLVAAVNGKEKSEVITIWLVETGKEVITFARADQIGIETLTFSPDGKMLATLGPDGRLRLRNIATGVVERTLPQQFNAIPVIVFSPDGSALSGRDEGGAIVTIDFSSGVKTGDFKGPKGFFLVPFIGQDKKTIAVGIEERTGETARQPTFANPPPEDEAESTIFKLWDVGTGREIQTFESKRNSRAPILSFDGKTLASGSGLTTIDLWDVTTGKLRMSLTGHRRREGNGPLVFSPDGSMLMNGHTRWDLVTGEELRLPDKLGVFPDDQVIFSPNGRVLAESAEDFDHPESERSGVIQFWSIDSAENLAALDDSVPLAFSPDGKFFASFLSREPGFRSRRTGKIRLWSFARARVLRSHDIPLRSSGDWSIIFSPDSKKLAININDRVDSKTEVRLIEVWNTVTGKTTRMLGDSVGDVGDSNSAAFSPDSKRLAVVLNNRTVRIWDALTGQPVQTLISDVRYANSLVFSTNGKTLATRGYRTVKLWDVDSGIVRRTFSVPGDYGDIAYSPDGKMLAYEGDDGTIRLIQSDLGTELASLMPLDQQDWLVTTPEGLFDGSPAAWKQIIWRFSQNSFDVVPVEAFFNDFYRPGLLADIISGRPVVAPIGRELSQLDRRQIAVSIRIVEGPAVSTARESEALTVEVEVEEAPPGPDISDESKQLPPSGARDIRLFRNGSLVKLWRGEWGLQDGCELRIPTGSQNARRALCTVRVPLVGGENRLTAYAFNNDKVKSLDGELAITRAKDLKSENTLRILAIGVGRYQNPQYDLNYTVADARGFAAEVKRQQTRLGRYRHIEVTTLLDGAATKASILSALKQLAVASAPEDAVMVFFSGHGTAQQDRFYLIPHDLGYMGSRQRLTAAGLQAVLSHSVSDLELEEAFRRVDAAQLFLVIDACNSGQALEAEEKRRGPMNTKGLAQLAYEKGMYVLTASQSVELAFESAALKHSYLTFALVEEGLKTNAADTGPKDGQVYLREWFDYVRERVPRMRQNRIARSTKRRSKSLELIEVAERDKVQTPRVFYRREPDAAPFIVKKD